MLSQPLVSIVIPFHNHREYLGPAVVHLRDQSYGAWEVLLVDNNSTDGSREVAVSLAQEDPERVRYVHQPIQGIPFARNKGLSEARGRYVSFLDVDDCFAPTKLADQVPILEAHPEVAMVYGLTRRVYRSDGRQVIQDVGVAREGVNEPPSLAVDWLRCFYHLPQTGATLARTEVARCVGGFDEGLLLGNDDVAYHLKLALDHRIWFLNREAVVYYRHSASEGARLNRQKSVSHRYADTFSSWIVPYTHQYQERTGDAGPRYWAEHGLAGNLAELASREPWPRRGRLLRRMLGEQRARGYLLESEYALTFLFHACLPRRWAKRATRLAHRLHWGANGRRGMSPAAFRSRG